MTDRKIPKRIKNIKSTHNKLNFNICVCVCVQNITIYTLAY